MDAHKNTIMQFLTATHRCFMIPVYQRDYDWLEDNCSQLWRDIWDIAQDDKKKHFLGAICSKMQNSIEKTIIDGQQRLTTITLLVKAMHDHVTNEDLKKDLDSNYLHNYGYGVTVEHKVKLHLNKADDEIFNKLLNANTDDDLSKITDKEQKSRIYQNYVYFSERVKGLDEGQIDRIKSALDRLVFVDVDIDEEDPQEIFESLNSTGMDLTNVDRIRNYLLMNLDRATQVTLYNDYWYKMEQNVRKENMVQFFIDYLIFTNKSDSVMVNKRRAHINANHLYIAFKNFYANLLNETPDGSSSTVTESILKDMYECSKTYKHLVFDTGMDMNAMNEMDQVIYSIVYINQAIFSRSLLMYIMGKYLAQEITYDQVMIMLKGCLSLVFRAKVVGNTGINGQFAGNVINRLSKYDSSADPVTSFWVEITAGKDRFSFPSDPEFKKNLVTRKIFDVLRSSGTKYLFYVLEQNNAASSKGLPRYDDSTITVEHVMPQTLTPEWKEYLGDDLPKYDDNLNKLGNLALTNYNPEMSNKPFEEKKGWYKDAKYLYTNDLTDYEDWDIEQIASRGSELADLCVGIWALPNEYQTTTLDDFVEDVSKKKPAFRFSMVGLAEGDEVVYISDTNKIATVIDETHVEYEGKAYSLSRLAAVFMGRDKSDGIAGPLYFTYNGATLDELRNEYESNMHIE